LLSLISISIQAGCGGAQRRKKKKKKKKKRKEGRCALLSMPRAHPHRGLVGTEKRREKGETAVAVSFISSADRPEGEWGEKKGKKMSRKEIAGALPGANSALV